MFDNMTVFFRCGGLMSGGDGQRGMRVKGNVPFAWSDIEFGFDTDPQPTAESGKQHASSIPSTL